MIYAMDKSRDMLVEFKSISAFNKAQVVIAAGGRQYAYVSPSRAHDMVRKGYTHETGLWLDGNRIKYARGE